MKSPEYPNFVTNGIVGLGSVVFSGLSTNIFGGVNAYYNNTYISNGVLKLEQSEVIPSGGVTTGWLILDGGAAAAGTLDLNGFNQTVNALSGLGNTVLGRILNNGGTLTNTLTINSVASTGYAGLILDNSGSGGKVALVVEGNVTQTLSGANTFSGGTTINYPGTLLIGQTASLGTGMTTLMGGTLGASVNNLSLNGNNLTVPALTNGTINMTAQMRLPALYGAGTLNVNVNNTHVVDSGHLGDSFSACVNFTGVVNVYGQVGGAQMDCAFNGGSFDGQLQNATVNLFAGGGGGVSLVGVNGSAGNTGQFGALNVDASSSLGGGAYAGSMTYQIGALNTDSDIEGNIFNGLVPSIIVKVGTGKLILNGSDTYTGATTINAGRVVVGASSFMANSSIITVSTNGILDVSAANPTYVGNSVPQTLAGFGAVIGNISAVNTAIMPGGNGTVGTLSFSNNVAFTGNVTNTFDIPLSGANDLLAVAGTLDISGSGNLFNINVLNTTLTPGTYTLATFSALTSSGSPVASGDIGSTGSGLITLGGSIVGQIRNLTLINTGTSIQLVVGAGSSLTWVGDGSANKWDLTNSPDWSGPSVLYQDDSVTFNDTSVNQTVNLTGTLAPTAINVSATASYVFTNTGKLTATTGIAKSGTGTLIIANTGGNDYSGQVTITGGTLKAGVATALGSTNGATIISGTGALDFGGFNLGAEPVTVSGAGSGSGAILNSGAAAQNALQYVTLAGDTTFGGTNRWDIRANTNGFLAGNNHNLTKVSTNDIYLVGLGNTALNNIQVTQGRLGVQDSTLLGTGGTLTLFAGAGVDFWVTTVTNTKSITLTNATVSSSSGTNVYGGSINLNGIGTFTATTPLALNGVLGGSGGVLKLGASILTLTNAETYTGNTTISNGILTLTGVASIASSTNIDVTAGSQLDVSSLASTFSLVSGQTLKGAGSVKGSVNIPAGSTIAPGESVPGTLTVSNNVTLAGTNIQIINASGNSKLVAGGGITYGGTLVVNNAGATLGAGTNLILFSAASYSGSFSQYNLPTLAAGLGWVTTNLAVNGTLSVVQTLPPTGTNLTFTVSGNTLTLNWPLNYTGWLLQSNSVDLSNTNDWFLVPGSAETNVFYRMAHP